MVVFHWVHLEFWIPMFCETMNNESLKRNINTKTENSFNMTRIPEIYGLNPEPTYMSWLEKMKKQNQEEQGHLFSSLMLMNLAVYIWQFQKSNVLWNFVKQIMMIV